ncbi:MAG TPA: hypothetical protein VNZ86_03965 [Bacteroidia bacterium]|jgi:hypothetical protein|nr:hypothetical protein [Bacteroidia bacterium]
MKLRPLHVLSLCFALLPMVVGSVIFWLWYWVPEWGNLPVFGLILDGVSAPLLILGIIFEFFVIYKNKDQQVIQSSAYKTIALSLLNIPLLLFYLWFGDILYNTNRITLINATGSDINQISVYGAGDLKHIEHLGINESQTIWYRIREEGSIQLKYSCKGSEKQVTIDRFIRVGGEKYDFPIKP